MPQRRAGLRTGETLPTGDTATSVVVTGSPGIERVGARDATQPCTVPGTAVLGETPEQGPACWAAGKSDPSPWSQWVRFTLK